MISRENNFAFLDSQNLNLGIRAQDWELDFARFRVYLKDKHYISKAFLFIGYMKGNEALYKHLQESGYICIFKPTLELPDGEVKGNVDAELVLHTMIHINTEEGLMVGFKKAKKLSPLVVIEEELRGYLFRGTLIGGKLVGVVKRDQPEVKGDGVHTLHELLDEENKIAKVFAPEEMLSLAIGREGQNVRLAAKLTGYRIQVEPSLPKKAAKTKKVKKVIKKKSAKKIIEAEIAFPGRLKNEMLAVAKNRLISVPNCDKESGFIRVKIRRTKHNIFLGELLS